MAASYPSAAKTFTTKATSDTIAASHVNDLQDEVTAVEQAMLTGGLAHNVFPSGSRTLGTAAAPWSKVFGTAVIVGTEDTSGARLDMESGTLAAREGDDSAYVPVKALTLEATGDITAGDQLFERGRATAVGEFASYTPTWTASSVNPSLGDGTLTGKYAQVGKTVIGRLKLVIGSTSTMGTGYWQFTLPVAFAGDMIGHVSMYDTSTTNTYVTIALGTSGSTMRLPISGQNLAGGVDSDTPFTWATGDELAITFSYEGS